jgi:ubiquinone/menaquinone biosynthesis C-methylase UbiE
LSEQVTFSGGLAVAYADGRQLPPGTLDTWMTVAARHLTNIHRPILDLGAGQGRFSYALAATFGVPVLAVEVANDMRQRIPPPDTHPTAAPVCRIGGRAEAIPFGSGTVSAVWASQVLHHVTDMNACARELHRVLVPGARILVRGGFHDRARPATLNRYFPGLSRLADEGVAVLAGFRDALQPYGLDQLAHEVVQQISAASLRDLYDRARLRARSPLRRLSDQEFAAGLELLGADADRQTEPRPVIDPVDLLVFG